MTALHQPVINSPLCVNPAPNTILLSNHLPCTESSPRNGEAGLQRSNMAAAAPRGWVTRYRGLTFDLVQQAAFCIQSSMSPRL